MGYEYFYPGTAYPLEPSYGELFTGYRVPVSEIGAPTSIQTANQIQEITNLLNQGGKVIELQPLQEGVFDQIPKQHFKEINRLTKLTGAETTVHAPMIDPAGFSREGWSEAERQEAERQLKSVIEKSHDLNPQGNIPVTIHASAIPGTEYSKPSSDMIETYKRQISENYGRAPTQDELKRLEESQIIAINQETGQLVPIKREERYYPEYEKKVIKVPEEEIQTVNNSEWINSITNLAFYKKNADDLLLPAYTRAKAIEVEIKEKGAATEEQKAQMNEAIKSLNQARLFLGNVESSFRMIYNKAYKYSDDETRKKLDGISKMWRERTNEMQTEKDPINLVITESNLVNDTLNMVRGIRPPNVYKKVEDFAVEKSANTLASAALEGYKNYGSTAPIVSIENLYPGMAFSRSEELKELVEATRKKFVEKAQKEGFSSSEAENAAKRLIGVTWDVGHLNILRKAGFKEEEIVKETEKIAKLVKHVHLTDNFGFSDSHLAPGMGNVPIKKILEELEKAGVKAKKIVEAGAFVQHFKVSPTQYVLEALGSPIYGMVAAPYWNQIQGTQGRYFAFPSAYFPEQHISMYGSGFSSLPQELGGQIPGKQSRMSGTPME